MARRPKKTSTNQVIPAMNNHTFKHSQTELPERAFKKKSSNKSSREKDESKTILSEKMEEDRDYEDNTVKRRDHCYN
jgi:hypothetical protein